MAPVLQTMFSNAFSSMKIFVFWLKFHWSLFIRVQLPITQHWFRSPVQQQAIIETNKCLVYWCTYVSLRLNGLMVQKELLKDFATMAFTRFSLWHQWTRLSLVQVMAACHNQFNTLRQRRNEQHFADDIFKRIFFNEDVWISIKIITGVCSRGSN